MRVEVGFEIVGIGSRERVGWRLNGQLFGESSFLEEWVGGGESLSEYRKKQSQSVNVDHGTREDGGQRARMIELEKKWRGWSTYEDDVKVPRILLRVLNPNIFEVLQSLSVDRIQVRRHLLAVDHTLDPELVDSFGQDGTFGEDGRGQRDLGPV